MTKDEDNMTPNMTPSNFFKQWTEADFREFGVGSIGYVKRVPARPTVAFGNAQPGGTTVSDADDTRLGYMFAVCTANGETLTQKTDMQGAIKTAEYNDIHLVTLH